VAVEIVVDRPDLLGQLGVAAFALAGPAGPPPVVNDVLRLTL